MNDKQYYEGVRRLLDSIILVCAKIPIDIGLVSDLGIETNKRLEEASDD